jgi:two-component system sensor histidine kinase BaeS
MAAALHKFKSKLTVVAALSDVVSRSENVSAEQAGRLKHVSDSARDVASGLHDLIENGRIEFHEGTEKVNLSSLASHAARESQPLFDLRNQNLVFNGPVAVYASCNYEIILEAVRNLLSNSSKHAHDESTTYLSVGLQQRRAFIEVADNGPGIPTDRIDHVTEAYRRYRLPGELASNGIGLPVVRQAIEAHGGSITVASVPERGTVVTMFLAADTLIGLDS